MPPTTSFVSTIRDQCARRGDAIALRYLPAGQVDRASETLTFAAVDARACALAAVLQAAGAAGKQALLLHPPGLDFAVAFLGCLYAGVVAVPAYPPDPTRLEKTLPRVRAIAQDAGVSFILTSSFIERLAAGIRGSARELDGVPWISTDLIPPDAGAQPTGRATGLAFLQYTSGSTASPKGVMVTHENLLHNSRAIARAGGTGPESVAVNWLPGYHDMGLIGAILQPLFSGFCSVLMPPMAFLARPARWLQAISHFRGTASAFPGFALDLCVRKVTDAERAGLDLSCWETAWNGAEPIRAESLDRFVERFGPCGFRRAAFFPVYGLAESTLFVSGLRTGDAVVARQVSRAELAVDRVGPARDAVDRVTVVGCGAAIEDTDLAIVCPTRGCRVGPDEVGEIWVRGPSVGAGYWSRPALSAEAFQAHIGDAGPFLRTGDLGFVHDGQLFVTGRRKDVIIIRGANFYPQDIERAVEHSHPAIRAGSVAAVALEGPDGERLGVVAEVRGAPIDRGAIIQAARAAVAEATGLAVHTLALASPGAVPKTSSGKIQRFACRAGLLDGSLPTLCVDVLATVDPGPARREGVVIAAIARITGTSSALLTPRTRLLHTGLDSLGLVELEGALRHHFGALPTGLLADPQVTLGALIDALDDAGPSADLPARPAPRPEASLAEFPEVQAIRAQLAALGPSGNPFNRGFDGVARDMAEVDGQRLINFATYNYLGLSGDPRVDAATIRAVATHGTSASASRVACGERPVHRALEQDLASFLGCEDALVFASGHATNVAAVSALVGPSDLVLHDRLAHDSLVAGARLAGARRIPFPHNDMRALEALLAELRPTARRVLIVVEGAYSMDGDCAPLAALVRLKQRYGALLYVDEAHALGVTGATGRGTAEAAGVDPRDVDVWMGTLSKALGSCGGYIAGSRALTDLLRYRAGGFVFAAAIGPPAAAAAREALRILATEPARVERLRSNAARFVARCRARGVDVGATDGTAIVPVVVGDSRRCLDLSEALRRQGVLAPPIIHPAVEEGLARLRFFISALHTDEQLERAADALAAAFAEVPGGPRTPADAPSLAEPKRAS